MLTSIATNGALAQLGERLLCKHQVIGSIPIGSTTAQRSSDMGNEIRIFRDAVTVIRPVFDIVNGF